LTSENNQLHLQLIRITDERTVRESTTKETLRKYEDELSDLRFLNNQYMNQIRLEQQKWEQERDKVETFIKKQQAFGNHLNHGKGLETLTVDT
jgi:TolA-binding protein